MNSYKLIPLEKIARNPEQPRKRFEEKKLHELAQSIQEHGVIQPIEVELGDGVYILHEGERRLLASQMAETGTIPAIIVPSANGKSQEERMLRTLVANIQREDLNPVEEGHAFLRLIEDFGYTFPQAAEKVGKHESHLRNRVVLTRLDPEIQDLISAGDLHSDTSLARELMKIDNKDARIGLAKSLASKKLTLKGSKEACRRLALSLKSEKIDSIPSLYLASRKFNFNIDENTSPPGWSMLEVVKEVPPWDHISSSAIRTCQKCELLDVANVDVCGRCPAVILIEEIVNKAVCNGS